MTYLKAAAAPAADHVDEVDVDRFGQQVQRERWP